MQIDCYGFEATSQWFKRWTLEPYMFMHVDDVLYLRYSAAEVGPVHHRPWHQRRTAYAVGVGRVGHGRAVRDGVEEAGLSRFLSDP